MANLQENYTCGQRQHYQSIYSPGFGTDSSQFFSKNLGMPRTEYDMVFGVKYQPKNAVSQQTLKDSCRSCVNQPESRYDGQWFMTRENYSRKNKTKHGVVSGNFISGV